MPLLEQRRHQLAEEGAAWLLTSLACGRKDQAHHLINLPTPIWRAQAAIVVLYPAEESLVDMYRRRGSRLDAGATRRDLTASDSVRFPLRFSVHRSA